MNITIFNLAIIAVFFPLVFIILIITKGFFIYLKKGTKKKLIQRVKEIKTKTDYTEIDEINPTLIFITLALEDRAFFSHKGLNFQAMKNALIENIKHRQIVMGGSTLSQQLAKNLLFVFDRTPSRKIAELFALRVIEKEYSKEEILEIYLNCIEYGHDNWSIASACNYYFNTSPRDITLADAVSLISILPYPKLCTPFDNPTMFNTVRSNAISTLKDEKYLAGADDTTPLETSHEDLYQELYSNALRFAASNKTRLEVNMGSKLVNNFFNRSYSSQGLALYAENIFINCNTHYKWGGMMDESSLASGEKFYTCDCSGLIKSYYFGGINHPDYDILYDLNSSMFLATATKKGKMENFPDVPGLCLYLPGHVSVYVGNGQIIEATDNPDFGNGVVKTQLEDRDWTDWFYCPFISR